MAQIKISTALAYRVGVSPGILQTASLSQYASFNRSSAGDLATASRIRIMSGPVPSQQEIEDAYPTWDRWTGSPTEILIDYQLRSSAYIVANTDGTITWSLASVTAATSGVATWWMWSASGSYIPLDTTIRGDAPGAPDSKRLGIVMGDITVNGGGGSMTLVDTSIVAGSSYDIGPATFVIPREFTFI